MRKCRLRRTHPSGERERVRPLEEEEEALWPKGNTGGEHI